MLEKPDIQDQTIVACLSNAYGLRVDQIAFLPLGADFNTAVYRATTRDTDYFVKLRRADFGPASVAVPHFLHELGIKPIIAPIKTQTGQLWANVDCFKLILYPFIKGHNGYEVELSDAQRVAFGTALKQFHTANIPAHITNTVARETFAPRWREAAKQFIHRVEDETYADPIAAQLATFLKTKRVDILALVERAEQLAATLQAQPLEFILCHGDIHGWNLLIDMQGALYIVDWDTLIFAPKERDLMFIGGGLGGRGHTMQEETTLFYRGYGQTSVDPTAIAYYRYERIIEDIAVYCEQLLLTDEGGADRPQSLEHLKSNFRPNGTIAAAYQADTAP